jgi:hypothetical protein
VSLHLRRNDYRYLPFFSCLSSSWRQQEWRHRFLVYVAVFCLFGVGTSPSLSFCFHFQGGGVYHFCFSLTPVCGRTDRKRGEGGRKDIRLASPPNFISSFSFAIPPAPSLPPHFLGESKRASPVPHVSSLSCNDYAFLFFYYNYSFLFYMVHFTIIHIYMCVHVCVCVCVCVCSTPQVQSNGRKKSGTLCVLFVSPWMR